MKLPIPGVDPVAIALDEIQAGGDVRFSGIDLESGARVTVMIERAAPSDTPSEAPKPAAAGLVLMLTLHTVEGRQ